MAAIPEQRLVLLTGATGYVGGKLLPVLKERGARVRCLVRSASSSATPALADEIARGDVRDQAAMRRALDGVDTAYYLVHAMGESSTRFAEEERRSAEAFAGAAREAGVRRIVYLGGLGEGDDLSAHLRSRQQTGRLLAASGVPTVEFRAGIVIGCGSLSFELVRALVGRLPVMVAPRWVRVRTQAIAVQDVLAYLAGALDLPEGEGGVFEIGARDPTSYGEIMQEYARARRLRRLVIPVPVLTPHLSSLWLTLVTPARARVGRALVESLRNETIVRDPEPARRFGVQPRGLRQAIEEALAEEEAEVLATRWSDHFGSEDGVVRRGAIIVDSRAIEVPWPPARAFAPIRRIGGRHGWYGARALWELRGGLDRLVGGPGLRRGRRDPERLAVGEALDFWRVVAFEEGEFLLLRAEMKLPGEGWLRLEVAADGGGGSRLRQTALFRPRGLLGRAYWYALFPLHAWVFRSMLRGLRRAAADEPGRFTES